MSVVVSNALLVDKHEGGGVGLTLRRTDERLHPSVVVAIHAGRSPLVAQFAVGYAAAVVAYVAKLAARPAVEAPPHGGLHAIFGTHHGLAHVVQLVGVGVQPVFGHLGEEVGVVVKTTCQLVGVAPVHVGLQSVVPLRCIVVVECVAAGHGYVLQSRIVLLYLPGNLFHVAQRTLSPTVVRLVERRQGNDLVIGVGLNPRHTCVDELRPVVGVGLAVLHVVVHDARLLVFVEYQVDAIAHKVGHGIALPQHLYLRRSERPVVVQRLGGLERAAHKRQVGQSDVVDALAHVLLVEPRHVHSPAHGQLHALVRGGERHHNVARGLRCEPHDGRRTVLVLGV